MPLIELELIEELFTSAQKEEIIDHLRNSMAMIRNEHLRSPAEGGNKKPVEVKTRSA